jgi:hypothetical protein
MEEGIRGVGTTGVGQEVRWKKDERSDQTSPHYRADRSRKKNASCCFQRVLQNALHSPNHFWDGERGKTVLSFTRKFESILRHLKAILRI